MTGRRLGSTYRVFSGSVLESGSGSGSGNGTGNGTGNGGGSVGVNVGAVGIVVVAVGEGKE